MNTIHFFKKYAHRQLQLYFLFTLFLLIIVGGCDSATHGETTDASGESVSADRIGTGEDNESNENEATEEFLPYGKKHGNIDVSDNGKTIYVHGWVNVYELSDQRTKKAEKIVFCKDAGILFYENDGTIPYIPRLKNAPQVKEIEVESGNSTLYEIDGMLIKRGGADEYTEGDILIFCVPTRKGEVRIPDGIQVIDDCAFLGCSGVISVFLPSSIDGIGDAAFGDMKSCTNIQAEKHNKIYYSKDGVLYGRSPASIDNHPNVVAYPAGKPDSVYDTAPEYIEEIKEGAFLGANHLREVYLPSKVKVIQAGAFRKCKKLEKVMVKNKKKITVEGDAFDDCPRLKEHVKDNYN